MLTYKQKLSLIFCLILTITTTLVTRSESEQEYCSKKDYTEKAKNENFNCQSGGSKKITEESNKKNITHFNIVFFGSTGNLAQKYLWKAFFNMHKHRTNQNPDIRFMIYAASRVEVKEGREFVSKIMLNLAKCKSEDKNCMSEKAKFAQSVQYVRVKTTKDYIKLESKLDTNTQSLYGLIGSPNTYEAGRLYYLSIPPSAYSKTCEQIDKYLKPKLGKPWVRVVIEKPFGHDYSSANELSKKLSGYFDEGQLYRVDHYLGKSVVKQILPFRILNREVYEPLWNKEHIEKVEIVMKEMDDAAGRTSFYNEVGIIRDVMQNHMTELLSLIAMDIPDGGASRISEIIENKLKVLKLMSPYFEMLRIAANPIITGQYSTYNKEWLGENNGTSEVTNVPTFAATAFQVKNERWDGVPFILMTGKKLDVKSSYIRLVFKNNLFVTKYGLENSCKQLVFHIGGSPLDEIIAVSNSLPEPKFTLQSTWLKGNNQKTKTIVEKGESNHLFCQTLKETNWYYQENFNEPYFEILNAALDGSKHMFVATPFLLASWKAWESLINFSDHTIPQKYIGRGKDPEKLDFKIGSDGIAFHLNNKNVPHIKLINDLIYKYNVKEVLFRKKKAFMDQESHLLVNLTRTFNSLVEKKCKSLTTLSDVKSHFHVAFSGGETSNRLFKEVRKLKFLSWDCVHIWQVDERCVDIYDPEKNYLSNYLNLEKHLLKWIPIPHSNIHRMPVNLSPDLCRSGMETIYEDEINRLLPDKQFDLIILGVGTDGHTASLFPNQISNLEDENLSLEDQETILNSKSDIKNYKAETKFVIYTTSIQTRMTMNINLINRAKNIVFLVIGTEKRDIIHRLSKLDTNLSKAEQNQYPCLRIKPNKGNLLLWYIDEGLLN